MSFDTSVEGTPAPTPGQFRVNVEDEDGSTTTVSVSGVSVDDEVVTLELGSELESGQSVTVDYVHAADTPLRRAGGGDPSSGFVGQAVDVSLLGLLGAVANFVVSAEPGEKDVLATWDEVEGATSYRLRWRESGGAFETADTSTSVSGGVAVVTVSDYGRWEVRVRACNDAGCGPESAATVGVARAASLRLERSASRTITASWELVQDAASYTLSWRRIGADQPANIQAPAQSAAVRQAHSAANSPALDRPASLSSGQRENAQTNYQMTLDADRTSVDLSVPDDGAYRAKLQARGAGDELIAMASNHVNQAPGRPDTTPPWLVWGEIDGNRMRLYFSEPLNENVAVARFDTEAQFADCSCWTGGISDDPVEVSRNVVRVDLGSLRAIEGLRAYTSYISGLRDLAGNHGSRSAREIYLRNITGPPKVTDVVWSSNAGVDRFYMVGDTIRVKVNFSEAVDATGTPRLKIDLDPAVGGERWADYSGGSGTRNLEFSYTVVEGDLSTEGVAVIENTLELNGGAIRSVWATAVEDARLGHEGLRHNLGHKVVTAASAAPLLQSASVSSTTLTLTFSEALGAAASLSNDAFTVKKTPQGGTEREVSLSGSPAISGSTVTLTLSSAALATDEWVKVSYAKPTTGANNKLVDVDGSEVADFTDEWVTNTLDTTQPRLVSGEIESTGGINVELTLYFSKPLDERSGGAADRYRVALQWMPGWGGWTYTIKPNGVTISGNKVAVNYATRYARQRPIAGQVVLMEYGTDRNPSADRLRDTSGNAVSTPHNRGQRWYSDSISLTNLTQ